MSEADETSPVPRIGSTADLARRMDRMEQRQDSLDVRVGELTATVARVESNQNHAVELNKLRFDALDTGIKAVALQLGDFIHRIEGILEGSIETAQSRVNRELVDDYRSWRQQVDNRLDSHDARAQKNAGVVAALGGIKGVVLMMAAVASPVITVIVLVSQS